MTDECDFCRVVRGALQARVVHATDSMVAFFPLEPAVVGHTLVAPREHVQDFFGLSGSRAGYLTSTVLEVARGVRDILGADGMNLITSSGAVASQTVFHLHVHVVPRWAEDAIGPIWPKESPWSASELDAAAERISDGLANWSSRHQ